MGCGWRAARGQGGVTAAAAAGRGLPSTFTKPFFFFYLCVIFCVLLAPPPESPRQPGDECRLRSGRYEVGAERCEVGSLRGTEASPMLITSAGDVS